MAKSSCIGFCRSSDNAKLGQMIDGYIAGSVSEQELKTYCKKVRLENLQAQKNIGIDIIPSNDFAMYDHMLDATCLVGNIQRRYYWEGGKIPLEIYFSLANGAQKDKFDVVPLKLQNWLNTNYLYHVPEFVSPIEFSYSDNKPIIEYLDAKSIGIQTRPTIISPIAYLLQGRSLEQDIEPIDLIDEILPVYLELFLNYRRIGVNQIQIEDPMICFAIDRDLKEKYTYCYNELKRYADDMEIHLVTYYCNLRENFNFVCSIPVDSIHIDVPYNIDYLDDYIGKLQKGMKISLGVADARNVWKNNLSNSIEIVSKFCDKIGSENVVISNSSPLFLCPYSVQLEKNLPANLRKQLSFAVEKLQEVEIIKTAINKGNHAVDKQLKENKKLFNGNNVCMNYFFKTKFGGNSERNVSTKWNEFIKNNNIKDNPLMFSGNADIGIQNEQSIDIASVGFAKKSYDISDYKDYVKGVFVLENNVIPRFGSEYYHPLIIYDDLKIKNSNIFENCIKNFKKTIKKPLKFNVCSPVHFMNFAFISPFINFEKNYQSFSVDLVKCIQRILSDIDILQIDEFTFTTGRSLNNYKNINEINNCFCQYLNDFIEKVKSTKCIILHNSFGNINDITESIFEIKTDLFMLSSVRSGHEILNVFTKFKLNSPVCLGAIDLCSSRTSTKNELSSSIKKIFTSVDKNNLSFTMDGDFYSRKKSVESVAKSLKIFDICLKDTLKWFEKEEKQDKKNVKKVKQIKSKKHSVKKVGSI